ncbi:MAG: hypothetical protein DPW09_33915 [Anaerolineae bacterium]|nr:hypothetical protein [Anaerolineales bacterium]MCQ3978452.1 hypothetical protein [Anaerolineae bacterium]
MSTPINSQLTAQGVLIPLQAVQEWLEQGLEIVKDKEQIIIRPKPPLMADRVKVLQVLDEAGLLAPPEPLPPDFKPLSAQEKAALSHKLSAGRPLSDLILAERADRI